MTYSRTLIQENCGDITLTCNGYLKKEAQGIKAGNILAGTPDYTITTDGDPLDFDIENNDSRLYASTDTQKVIVYDLTMTPPEEIAEINLSENAPVIDVDDNYLYIANDNSLDIYYIEDLERPIEHGNKRANDCGYQGFAARGGFAYNYDGSRLCGSVLGNESSHPQFSRNTDSGTIHSIHLLDNLLLCLTNRSATLYEVNSTGNFFKIFKEETSSSEYSQATLGGNYLFLALSSGSIHVMDISEYRKELSKSATAHQYLFWEKGWNLASLPHDAAVSSSEDGNLSFSIFTNGNDPTSIKVESVMTYDCSKGPSYIYGEQNISRHSPFWIKLFQEKDFYVGGREYGISTQNSSCHGWKLYGNGQKTTSDQLANEFEEIWTFDNDTWIEFPGTLLPNQGIWINP